MDIVADEEQINQALIEIEDRSHRLAQLNAQKAELEAAITRERDSISAAMQGAGFNKFASQYGDLLLARAPGKTNVAMSNAEFARRWPQFTRPDIAASRKAAKDDPELAEILIQEDGEGVVLKFKVREAAGDESFAA